MKIRFLGTGDMGTKRGCASFVLDDQILFDCGFGTVRTLIDSGLDIEDINVLVLSHFHIDHTGDLLFFLTRREYKGWNEGVVDGKYIKEKIPMKPLTIVAPLGFKEYLLSIYNGNIVTRHKSLDECAHLNLDGVTIIEMDEDGKFVGEKDSTIDGINITSFGVNHLSKTGNPYSAKKLYLGYIIQIGNKVIGCSGDTNYCDGLEKNLPNAEVWVIDCARPKNGPTKRHMSLDCIEKIALQYPDKKSYTIHRRFDDIPSSFDNIFFPLDGEVVD